MPGNTTLSYTSTVNPISCIIVEDEPLALERTKSFVLRLPYLKLSATFDNAVEAVGFLKENKIELLLLDINMGDFSGIQMLEAIDRGSEVIITTAYPEYALKGYDLQVADYLLKPYTFPRFVQAVERATSRRSAGSKQVPDSVFIRTAHRMIRIRLDEVLYIEGARDYRKIHMTIAKHMTLLTFGELERLLPEHLFCRVHKSFLVSVSSITAVEHDRVCVAGIWLPVSGTHRKALREKIERGRTY